MSSTDYPTSTDYDFSLHPENLPDHLAASRPSLDQFRTGMVVRPQDSLYLHVASGAYAYVYRLQTPAGRQFAIRALRKRPPKNSAERFQSIGRLVRERRPAYLVECDHHDAALWVSVGPIGGWYPFQVMEWVNGETLLVDVARHTAQGNVTMLAARADKWRDLIKDMKSDGVTHGDLHPDNVLVTPSGELVLVDYDTLTTPEFRPAYCEGGGMETYLHPSLTRGEATRVPSPHQDDFGALNIYLSLRVLAYDPSLRLTHDYLLFGWEDINQPLHSRLMLTLCESKEPEIRRLACAFRDECVAPYETGTFTTDAHLSDSIPPPKTSGSNSEKVKTINRSKMETILVDAPSSAAPSKGRTKHENIIL